MPPSTHIALAGERPPLVLAAHPALDFLNSRATPSGITVEWLGDGDSLLRWMSAAGLLPPDLPELNADGHALDSVAAEARGLREWLRGFVAGREGAPLVVAADALQDLRPLNALLAEDEAYRQVEALEDAVAWGPARRRDLRAALLQPLAAVCGDLVCATDFRRIRRCGGPGCTLWFLDLTKAGTRRWCSMALCGNRAKVGAHRRRRGRVLATTAVDGNRPSRPGK